MLAIGLLLFPVVMLVGVAPAVVGTPARRDRRPPARRYESRRRSGRPTAGVDAERVAREVVDDLWHCGPRRDGHGVTAPARGGLVTATVTVRMPALAVPLLASVGAWSWTARESVRIDDYRSR